MKKAKSKVRINLEKLNRQILETQKLQKELGRRLTLCFQLIKLTEPAKRDL